MTETNVPAITVFTPTYNRAHTLPRLYRSLLEQTFRDFEWLIIDDGSTDGTEALVGGWMSEGLIRIRYIYQPNGGKHTAFDHGVREARAPLFASIDSDDVALPHTLEAYLREWKSIDDTDRKNYSGVSGLCIDDRGDLVGTRYPFSPMTSDLVEIRYRWHVRGDKHGCYATGVLREHPFPHIEGAKFIPEGVVWSQVAKGRKHRFFNEVVLKKYIYESAGNQLTKVPNPSLHARTHAFWHQGKINDELHWFKSDPVAFLRSGCHYSRFSFHSGHDPALQFRQMIGWKSRTLWLVTLPFGIGLYCRDLWKIRRMQQQEAG